MAWICQRVWVVLRTKEKFSDDVFGHINKKSSGGVETNRMRDEDDNTNIRLEVPACNAVIEGKREEKYKLNPVGQSAIRVLA